MGPTAIKLKVCGMRDTANVKSLAAVGPDYMGFIFYEKSPRYVGAGFEIPGDFPSSIQRVGVFVNAAEEEIEKRIPENKLSAVQLHGHETPEMCSRLMSKGVTVIKAFSVGEGFDFATCRGYESCVSFFLFDTKGKHYGGNAAVFDWKILDQYPFQIPFFLSGGLTPENIQSVSGIQSEWLYAVDINSGVEIQPGIKDPERVKLIKKQLQQRYAV